MSEVLGEPSADEKPVSAVDVVDFPPFPDPEDDDFEDDIGAEEREFYKSMFSDLNLVKTQKLHCSACDRHLGCAAKNDNKMRMHPMLRTLVCHSCYAFYNSGEFDKGEDGSELYCRWCGQGGQVYCCSDCIHVFCAKCIKRNFGIAKIKEIENTDDWKCFKCVPRPLWERRALCWALLRYCDLRNKLVYKTEDSDLKEKYQKACAVDESECCRDKKKRGPTSAKKNKEEVKKEKEDKKPSPSVLHKIPPTIQVKKFASINLDELTPKIDKRKRPKSPKSKPAIIKNPINIAPYMKPLTIFPTQAKRMKVPITPMLNQFGGNSNTPDIRNKFFTYTPRYIRPKAPVAQYGMQNFYNMAQPPQQQQFNGYNNMTQNIADNINLSLEELTQGLDMAAVTSMANNKNQDDLVCTPDFPLEPLCEVLEENDDDIQCITPVPMATPKPVAATKPRQVTLPDLSSGNIVQMTENDVTVNAVTGGLKFRVDPQTLSSNKMYRLPDGRIFAINANPNMPGGYSATIVAVTESQNKAIGKSGATYAAKLSAVPANPTPTPPPLTKINYRAGKGNNSSQGDKRKDTSAKITKISKNNSEAENRQCDLEVPVEWYRYNVIDAVDALEYSLTRLRKLKKEATTMYLRTRTVDEMRHLHKSLVRLLNNSAVRFNEVCDNLNKGMKQYVQKKSHAAPSEEEDDDDDVEILNEKQDDPIFIDEDSVDSLTAPGNEKQDVELLSSDLNDSEEREHGKQPNGMSVDANQDYCDEIITGDIINENVGNNESQRHEKSPSLNKISSDDVDDVNKLKGNEEETNSDEVIKDKGTESTEIENLNDTNLTKSKDDKEEENLLNENDITDAKDDEIDGHNDDKKETIDTSVINETEASEQCNESENEDSNEKAIDESDSEFKKQEENMDVDENHESEDGETNDSKDVETVYDDDKTNEKTLLKESNDTDIQNDETKLQDAEMSDELINTLLNDDTVDNVAENLKSLEKDLIGSNT